MIVLTRRKRQRHAAQYRRPANGGDIHPTIRGGDDRTIWMQMQFT